MSVQKWAAREAGPTRGGHILRSCPTGTTQLLAAPPAGFLNCLVQGVIKNAHGASALTFRLSDANGDVLGPSGNSLAAGSNSIGITFRPTLVTDSAISITVSGTGSPAEVHFEYHQIPKPDGFSLGVVALTNAYQAIPNVVPSEGAAKPWSALLPQQSSSGALVSSVWNGDSGAVQLQFRLIRDGVTYDWNVGGGAGATIAAFSNSSPALPFVLLPADQVQVKVASINTPGAAILRAYMTRLQRA